MVPSLSNGNNVIARLSMIIVQKCYISCAGIIHMVLGSRILLNYMFGYCDLRKDITIMVFYLYIMFECNGI